MMQSAYVNCAVCASAEMCVSSTHPSHSEGGGERETGGKKTPAGRVFDSEANNSLNEVLYNTPSDASAALRHSLCLTSIVPH